MPLGGDAHPGPLVRELGNLLLGVSQRQEDPTFLPLRKPEEYSMAIFRAIDTAATGT